MLSQVLLGSQSLLLPTPYTHAMQYLSTAKSVTTGYIPSLVCFFTGLVVDRPWIRPNSVVLARCDLSMKKLMNSLPCLSSLQQVAPATERTSGLFFICTPEWSPSEKSSVIPRHSQPSPAIRTSSMEAVTGKLKDLSREMVNPRSG